MKKSLILSATISLLLLLTHSTRAQAPANTGEALRRFEVGGHAFAVNGDTLGNGFGVGGRFTYNFNKYLAADNEVNTFLNDEAQHVGTEGLFGLKAGVHYRRIGVFAKARPGFVSNIALNGSFAGQTKPAFDAGGIFEVYMSDHGRGRHDGVAWARQHPRRVPQRLDGHDPQPANKLWDQPPFLKFPVAKSAVFG
jgi:hypothetical protein